jgi:hypothetical protein
VRVDNTPWQVRDHLERVPNDRSDLLPHLVLLSDVQQRASAAQGSPANAGAARFARNVICFVTCAREISSPFIASNFAWCSFCRALSASMRLRFHCVESITLSLTFLLLIARDLADVFVPHTVRKKKHEIEIGSNCANFHDPRDRTPAIFL